MPPPKRVPDPPVPVKSSGPENGTAQSTGTNGQGKPPVRIAVSMPPHLKTREMKLDWLNRTVGETDCDLFMTPQEFMGGHYVMPNDLHMDRDWLLDEVGKISVLSGKHIAIGACCKTEGTGATEDFLYLDGRGNYLGHHSKYALPSYDDQRTGGHGQLWPETNYNRRVTPIELPKLRLRVGTVFCWEAFSQMLWASYSFAGVNLIMHPIKFAPRGWLKNKKKEDGLKHIVGFGNEPSSEIWIERLVMASKHQVMCPIAVSCNSWDLGHKMLALVGWVDEMRIKSKQLGQRVTKTELYNVPSIGKKEFVRVFEMVPEFYEGIDHHHSMGAFMAHVGSVDGYSEMGEHTMHGKIRRLEARLINGDSARECVMKVSANKRKKNSVRIRGLGLREVK